MRTESSHDRLDAFTVDVVRFPLNYGAGLRFEREAQEPDPDTGEAYCVSVFRTHNVSAPDQDDDVVTVTRLDVWADDGSVSLCKQARSWLRDHLTL